MAVDAVADAYFGKVLRDARPSTRTGRAAALTVYFQFLELRHRVELHDITGRAVECPLDEMNRPRASVDPRLRVPPSEEEIEQLFAGWREAVRTPESPPSADTQNDNSALARQSTKELRSKMLGWCSGQRWRWKVPGVLAARPLTVRCAQALGAGEHACIGVSPFNSYFSVERITELAAWAVGNFAAFHLFVPDTAAALTLRALGYAPGRAAVKARRQGQYVRNKICRALDGLGVADPGGLVLDSAVLEANARYRELARAAEQDFEATSEASDGFAAELLAGVSWVLVTPKELSRRRSRLERDTAHHATRSFAGRLHPCLLEVPVAKHFAIVGELVDSRHETSRIPGARRGRSHDLHRGSVDRAQRCTRNQPPLRLL